jgi:uncharacterized membrane protein
MTENATQDNRAWLWAPVLLSALGVVVSAYLSIKRFTGGSLACTRWADCDVVNNSVYAKIYGVPVAFIGLVGYAILLGLALAALQTEGILQRRLIGLGFLLAVGGVGFSAYLTYIEVYVIEAICVWCVISTILIVLLAILGGLNLWRTSPHPLAPPASPSSVRP